MSSDTDTATNNDCANCGHSAPDHWQGLNHGPPHGACNHQGCDCKRYKPTPDTATGAGKLSILPTHWAGGVETNYPNRIRIEGEDTVLAYIEHHGIGDGHLQLPTDDDYAFARDLTHRYNTQPDLATALRVVMEHIDELEGDERGQLAYRSWHWFNEARRLIATAKLEGGS